MVNRRGIGATSASAVIFSILLISNLALYVASQSRESLYTQADAEDVLGDGAVALAGAGAANILIVAQALLASGTFGCANAMMTVAGEVDGLTDVQRSGDLTVTTSAKLAQGDTAADNLSMLEPFNGSVAGVVNVALSVFASAGESVTRVSFTKTETHLVHLPFRIQRASDDCTRAIQNVASSIQGIVPTNCTTPAIDKLMGNSIRTPASTAASDGFELSLQYSITENVPCSVSYKVSIEQSGIQGPVGEFSVRMQGEGSAAFGQQVSPRKA